MPTNSWGPYGAGVNPSNERPADSGDPGNTDTWFKPCSSPTSRDGTVVSYRWLNKILGSLRWATRALGVPDDPASDGMLLEAIRRGGRGRNIGTSGYEIYDGQDSGDLKHRFRRLLAGSNVTITPVEGPTGEFALRITAAGGGGGEGDATFVDIGTGTGAFYKGFNSVTGNHEFRTLKTLGGVLVSTDTNEVDIAVAGGGWSLLMRNDSLPGALDAYQIHALSERTAPDPDDELLLQEKANGPLHRVRVSKLQSPQMPGVLARGRVTLDVNGSNEPVGITGSPSMLYRCTLTSPAPYNLRVTLTDAPFDFAYNLNISLVAKATGASSIIASSVSQAVYAVLLDGKTYIDFDMRYALGGVYPGYGPWVLDLTVTINGVVKTSTYTPEPSWGP